MGEAGFWDDQERAARVSAEHARATRKLGVFRALESDVADLEPLAELAEEDPEIAAEFEDQVRSVQERLDALEEERLFSGRYDAGDALVTVNAGAGGTDAQDWAEMVLRMEMRWARSGALEWSCWRYHRRGGGDQVGHVPGQGRERVRPVRQREGCAPAGAAVPVRLGQSPPDQLRGRRGLTGGRGGRGGRDRRRRPADRHLPRQRRRRPARQQDRLGDPHHPQADRHRRPVPERALAVLQQGRGDGDAALQLVELEERKRREEIARERGEAQDVNFGSQIRSYVLHPYTMVKDHRTDLEMGDVNRVLDGDLDNFVRAYLLKAASDPSHLIAAR